MKTPPPAPESGLFDADAISHRLPVRVYYEDTDFSGLVYHARYLHFLERGRSDFLRLVGVHHHALLERPDPLVFAVRRIELDYLIAARIDDALEVVTRFEKTRGARLRAKQEVQRDGERLLTAKVEAVCLTPAGRPRRPPADLLAALGPRLTKPAS